MPRPQTYTTHGIVLKHLATGEADRIVTVYTPDRGIVRAVARGARRTKSKMGGHLQPLGHVRLSIATGRSLDIVTEVETVESHRKLREDLSLVSYGLYLAELVDGFATEAVAHHAEFLLLSEALTSLETTETPAQLARCFEMRMLAMGGFGPELRRCVECHAVLPPAAHLFSAAAGGLVCDGCKAQAGDALVFVTLNAIKVMRYFQQHPSAVAMDLRVSPDLLEEVHRVLRSYLRHVLDRDMSSARFLGMVASKMP